MWLFRKCAGVLHSMRVCSVVINFRSLDPGCRPPRPGREEGAAGRGEKARLRPEDHVGLRGHPQILAHLLRILQQQGQDLGRIPDTFRLLPGWDDRLRF